MRPRAPRPFVLAVVLLCPSALYAQEITGTVRDTSGGVLPGVSVEASSPELIEGIRLAVTDGTGQYRIVGLRPGAYTVVFELAGFAPVRREGLDLAGDSTATVNAELAVGTIEETVTVTGASPIVDVQNTRQQRVMSNEVIDALPSGRTPQALGVLVPGVTGLGGFNDVGGTASLGAINYLTVHGSRPEDYRVMVDGFHSGGNGRGLQYSNNQPNVGSSEEVGINIAGNSPEQAQSGVSINFIPKEGGNTFTGLLFASGATEDMAGSNLTQRLQDAGIPTASEVKNSYDLNPAFGGPIVGDKLWFYASGRWLGYQNYQGMFANLHAGIQDEWAYVPDESRRAYNHGYSRSGNARFTLQVNQTHKLSVYYDAQYKCECLQAGNSAFWAKFGGFLVSPEAATEYVIYPTDTGTVTWTAPMTNRLLLEAGVAWRREDFNTHVRQEGDPVLDLINVVDVGSNLVYHGWTGGGDQQPMCFLIPSHGRRNFAGP